MVHFGTSIHVLSWNILGYWEKKNTNWISTIFDGVIELLLFDVIEEIDYSQ